DCDGDHHSAQILSRLVFFEGQSGTGHAANAGSRCPVSRIAQRRATSDSATQDEYHLGQESGCTGAPAVDRSTYSGRTSECAPARSSWTACYAGSAAANSRCGCPATTATSTKFRSKAARQF